jgi:hypothetical protein
MSQTPAEYKDKMDALKAEKLEQLRKELVLKPFLPHIYLLPHYKWSRKFYEYLGREAFMTAANQIGKSTVQIRKVLRWATETELWPKIWPRATKEGKTPNLFWYLYPDSGTFETEWATKWTPLMPKESMKETNPEAWAKYGWAKIRERGKFVGIQFNSGIRLEFRFYSQQSANLQAGTVYFIAFDEEMPVEHLPELEARLRDTQGIINGVFTATLGQPYWKQVMEGEGEEELRNSAFKQQISLYDCQMYEDGTPSKWTDEEITLEIKKCPTEADKQKRVFGKFAASGNLKYESFDRKTNMVKPIPVPPTWRLYGAVDIGSGLQNHKAAITIIAVNPENTQGRVIKAWRGDGVRTAAPDILARWRMMKVELEKKGYKFARQSYDWAAKDFHTIATSYGEPFEPANKNRDSGELNLNALFKNRMLLLHTGDPEIDKLANELESTTNRKDTTKNQDDLADSCRYCALLIPWDWTVIDIGTLDDQKAEMPEPEPELSGSERRLAYYRGTGPYAEDQPDELEAELNFWAEQYE